MRFQTYLHYMNGAIILYRIYLQSLEAAKAVIHTAELAALPVRLAEEQKVLQQHWLSAECQSKIRQLIATK